MSFDKFFFSNEEKYIFKLFLWCEDMIFNKKIKFIIKFGILIYACKYTCICYMYNVKYQYTE